MCVARLASHDFFAPWIRDLRYRNSFGGKRKGMNEDFKNMKKPQ